MKALRHQYYVQQALLHFLPVPPDYYLTWSFLEHRFLPRKCCYKRGLIPGNIQVMPKKIKILSVSLVHIPSKCSGSHKFLVPQY